ncbi:MAG: deoxyribonuclease IV [Simkaniaceae bacterium]
MQKTPSKDLLIGAHMSAQGGVHHALLKGHAIGATTIQLFTSNQRQWNSKPIPDEEVKRYLDALKETGIKKVMSHDSYLINLGSPRQENLEKSLTAFGQEIKRCHQLEISYMNFHPGAATGDPVEKCLDRIIESLLSFEDLASKGSTRLLLETTAGQGTTVGHEFNHLNYIIEGVKKKIPIGVCIDTCHIFAAGYDIRDRESLRKTVQEFDDIVGLKHLYALHINDSLHDLGSRKDRHAHLGKGKIGMEGFKAIMEHQKLRELPKYLETPEGDKYWKDEIRILRNFA